MAGKNYRLIAYLTLKNQTSFNSNGKNKVKAEEKVFLKYYKTKYNT